MSHDYHQGAANYNPHQLFYDGCYECKRNAEGMYPFDKIKDMRQAWYRAHQFEKDLLGPEEAVSNTEVRVLRILWSLMVRFEREGIPLGQYPVDTSAFLREMLGELKKSGESKF